MRHPLGAVAFLLLAVPAFAQAPLDLFPQNATAAVAIRDLDGLIKKGDKFLSDTEIRVPLRPSDLFDQAVQFLGANKGLNRRGSAALVLLNPEMPKANFDFRELETLLVPVIPFTDADSMAANFGIAKGMLAPKSIVRTTRARDLTKYATRSASHIFLSNSETTLKRLNQSKSIGLTLTPEQRKRLNENDILVHLGRYLWTMENGSLPKEIARKIKTGDDPQEKQFVELFTAGLQEVQNGFVGFRLDDGIDGQFIATVPKDGKAALMLAFLRGKRKSSTLKGLPEGNVLVAQASSGDSAQHTLVAKALFRFLLEDLLVQREFVASTDMLNYLGVFQEVWSRLEGNRVAVYQNANEPMHGLFSAVAILDSDDPHGFLREMRTLTKMAVADSLDFSKKEIKEEIDIDRLVRDLGSAIYRTRHSAATRLALIGEPALPHLQKAIDSDKLNLETLRRAQGLRQRISDVAAARRKELLAGNQPLFFRPKLTFVSAAEKRGGQTIDAIHVKIAGLEKPEQQKRYVQLLGPDWDKIRLAVVGKQIVVMLGSDVELFDAALRNVHQGVAGLAGSKKLAAFHERAASQRLVEFHVSVEGVLRLVTQNAKLGTPLQLTSASLSLGENSVQLDARVPTAEIRAIAKKAQEGIR